MLMLMEGGGMVLKLDNSSEHGAHLGVNEVEGLQRKSCHIRNFFGKDLCYLIRAQHALSYHLIQVSWSAAGNWCRELETLILSVQEVLTQFI